MIKSTGKVSVKQVSPGTYRVAARRGRSAITGRFVTKSSGTGAAADGPTNRSAKAADK